MPAYPFMQDNNFMMTLAVQFSEQHLITVYFFYGLAFFAMGLALLVESGRSSEFPFAAAMAPLAAFGIIHGAHEWLEMFQLLNHSGTTAIPDWLLSDSLRLLLLVVSFTCLLVFGVSLVYANHKPGTDGRLQALAAALTLILVWAISVLAARQIYGLSGSGLSAAADVLGRYILAIPGALLAGWAIYLEQRTFRERGMGGFGRALLGAATALIIYGTLGQLFGKTSPIFPSDIINSQLFISVTGFPVQLLRTICAIAMTLFIVRALRVFDVEVQQKLAQAQAARQTAQQAALAKQQSIEVLNQELAEAVRNLSSLYNFSQNLAKTLDSREMIEGALTQFIGSEPHIDASMVFLCDQEGEQPNIAARTQCPVNQELHDIMFEQARSVGEAVVRSKKPAVWRAGKPLAFDAADDLAAIQIETPPITPTGGRTLGVPLNIHGKCVGSLVMCTVPSKEPFSEREFSLISTAAEELSIALHNAALYKEIQDRDKLRSELLHQVVSAQEMERQRIARELHDGTGQTLTALGLGLAAVSGQIRQLDGKTSSRVSELKSLSTSAMIELRDVISDLRPAVLDDLGLIPALRGQIRSFEERSGTEAELIATGDTRRLSADLETIVFRIVQEALTNVNKHAQATFTNVELNYQADTLFIGICDNGRGFNVASVRQLSGGNQAWGLLGIQERVELAEGRCEIISTPGVGTTIEISIPIGTNEDNGDYGEY